MKSCHVSAAVLAAVVVCGASGALHAQQDPPGTPPRPQRGSIEHRAQPSQATSQPAESRGVAEYQFAEAPQDHSLLWDGARMVFSLAAVLLVLGVGVKFVRRWPGLAGRDSAGGPLQLLGRLPLTAKEAVCLVRAGGEVLVVGVSPAAVTLLHRLEGGLGDTSRSAAPSSAVRSRQGGEALSGGRLRVLAARIRDVQAAWGVGPTGSGSGQ
jgi:flagellar biogenesis protein FliO